ncbi:hypothetical protein PMIN06_001209 [Paraphaeosphaeria minitans]|uniref:Uncharacterized protein n=1 Tax=Paraphaeosphaeria minitans TaxID=565426 RepID=A0A9P6GLF1_9PLEO|nr:hypothetical protein PMIN01_05165 [Paraphaeosphaeria minitans]
MSTKLQLRYVVLSFFLGGFVFTGLDYLIKFAVPCGHFRYYEKECQAPGNILERRGLNGDTLNIPADHDAKLPVTFPVPLHYEDIKDPRVVIVPIAQDLDTNGDGVPDQPVVWELPYSFSSPDDKDAHVEDVQPAPSATPRPYLWREMDTSSPNERTKSSLPDNADLQKIAEVSGDAAPRKAQALRRRNIPRAQRDPVKPDGTSA